MDTLMNLDPWNLFDEIFDIPAFRRARARACGCYPPINVYQDENAVAIDVQLPGKTAGDVELSLEAQAVTLTDKPVAEEGKSAPRPAWSRRIELPFRVDAEKANAKFTNGILRIELPRSETAGIRRIAIAG